MAGCRLCTQVQNHLIEVPGASLALGTEVCPATKPLADAKGWQSWDGTVTQLSSLLKRSAPFLLVLLVRHKSRCAITFRLSLS